MRFLENTMKVLMIKNEHYHKHVEIKAELRKRGMFGKKYPKNLEQVPDDMKKFFEMDEPNLYI
jgi:hypothetical protein